MEEGHRLGWPPVVRRIDEPHIDIGLSEYKLHLPAKRDGVAAGPAASLLIQRLFVANETGMG
jgi:hypothetical protein